MPIGVYSRLWRSDGTEAGTRRVDDAWTGWTVAAGDTLFMYRGDLWKIDGSTPGSQLVAQIPPAEWVWGERVGNELFFVVRLLDTYDHELWKSDGTTAGTRRIARVDLLPPVIGSIELAAFATSNMYYFVAFDPLAGTEMWRSDGTEAGTHVLKDVLPGSEGSSIYLNSYYDDRPDPLFTAVDDTVFFVASDGAGGHELWKSNGTAAGTTRIKEIVAGPDGVFSSSAQESDPDGDPYVVTPSSAAGRAFYAFYIRDRGLEVWSSDGSEEGTQAIATISPPGVDPPYLTFAGGDSLFFTVSHYPGPDQLWRSDGTAAGTTIVREFPAIEAVLPHRGGAFLFANDGVSGCQPWWTDGTAAGTIKLRDVPLHENGSYPRDLTDLDGVLVFSAADEQHGRELWRSDATEGGTILVQDICPGRTAGASSGKAMEPAKGLLLSAIPARVPPSVRDSRSWWGVPCS